jgi:hypothetical protein
VSVSPVPAARRSWNTNENVTLRGVSVRTMNVCEPGNDPWRYSSPPSEQWATLPHAAGIDCVHWFRVELDVKSHDARAIAATATGARAALLTAR